MTSRADDYVHGVQTYVFTYTLENVTWHFDDTGLEFYWDVNGVDWAQPFGEVTARVHLDAALADQLTGRWACYAGVQGSTSSCTSTDVAPAEAGGVTLTLDNLQDGEPELDAALTPMEARALAAMLLQAADDAEGGQ